MSTSGLAIALDIPLDTGSHVPVKHIAFSDRSPTGGDCFTISSATSNIDSGLTIIVVAFVPASHFPSSPAVRNRLQDATVRRGVRLFALCHRDPLPLLPPSSAASLTRLLGLRWPRRNSYRQRAPFHTVVLHHCDCLDAAARSPLDRSRLCPKDDCQITRGAFRFSKDRRGRPAVSHLTALFTLRPT